MKILITGANGFIGSQLSSLLAAQGHSLLLACRSKKHTSLPSVLISNIDSFDNWDNCLADIDTVIHLAARVHQMDEQSDQVALNYQCTNVDATVRLAKTAIEMWSKTFYFSQHD